MSYSNDKLIADLRELHENVNLLKNLINRIDAYKEVSIRAKNQIDQILYKLTGDVYHL